LNVLNISLYYWEAPSSPTATSDDGVETMGSSYHEVLEAFNIIFTWLFIIEFVVKHLALGATQYWTNPWNKLDGFVVTLSFLGFIIEVIGFFADVEGIVLRIFRACRVLRVVRLLRLRQLKGCLRLLNTLVYTLPSLSHVAVLLLLVMFIFTTLGMSFFGTLPTSPDDVDVPDAAAIYEKYPFQMYNEHANFKYFYTGILLLFRMSTGESWNGIMHDCMSVYPAAWTFFLLYMLLVFYIMFNLLVAIVLNEFTVVVQQDEKIVTGDDIAYFATEWTRFDPQCTHLMAAKDLSVMLSKLPPPLGLKSGSHVMSFTEALHIPQQNGHVHYVETCSALIQHAYFQDALFNSADKLPMGANLKDWTDETKSKPPRLVSQLLLLAKRFPSILDFQDKEDYLETFAAMKLQATLRGYHARGTVVKQKRQEKLANSTATDDSSKKRWASTSQTLPDPLQPDPIETPALAAAAPSLPIEIENPITDREES